MAKFEIHLAKEPFKFSCSHFTILSSTTAERLHGHNYQVRVDLALGEIDPQLGMTFDFNVVKPLIRKICDNLDERILLPSNSPFLKFQDQGAQIEVRFHDRFYSFPKTDSLRLPLTNITSEELARYFGNELAASLQSVPGWTDLRVNIEETRGQSVSYSRAR